MSNEQERKSAIEENNKCKVELEKHCQFLNNIVS